MTFETDVRKLLEKNPQYRYLLFRRGYLISDSERIDLGAFPFFGMWREEPLGTSKGRQLFLYAHKDQAVTTKESGQNHIALIGHAYNPFTAEVTEVAILESLIQAWNRGKQDFYNEINELTGTFLIVLRTADQLVAVQDAAGLKACFYGIVSGSTYISSHAQLVSDILNLPQDPFIQKLIATKMYSVGNRYLPGNMSPFKALKRLGANTYLECKDQKFEVKRFFPLQAPQTVTAAEDVEKIVEQLAEILSQSIRAIALKWQRPAISLTGGTDSKTTLAAASDYYDELKFFSFQSKPSEEADAKAAAKICATLNLAHTLYSIPDSNDDITDYPILKSIIDHNTNYYKKMADHEIRKMIYLENQDEFDVEIKSWSSEIVRVFMERKYDLVLPAKLSPRHFSIFQTRYFGTPRLLSESDKIYEEFIREIRFDEASELYEASDLYYWEVRLGAWGSSVVSAFDYCHEVTIPFNNRRFLELFMSLPRPMRKSDKAHMAIVRLKEPKIVNAAADVKNRYFHSYRQIIEKVYYYYRIIPPSLKEKIRTIVQR